MISIGITILGLIAAMITNLSFSKGLIAFCLALAFCTASEICQICFTTNARFSADEEDESRSEQLLPVKMVLFSRIFSSISMPKVFAKYMTLHPCKKSAVSLWTKLIC